LEILMPTYTALITLLAVALYFALALRVAISRGEFGVPLPATSGNPDFERVFRVHQNTLEWLPTFLACLWICALFLSDIGAAALGAVRLVGRLLYAAGYSQAVEKRLPGFFIQSSACILLFLGAATGVVRHLLG
jgi:glutathione S-transferase